MSDKERREFEAQYKPLYNYFHRKNSGFKEKEAIFYNQNKITIFRGDDFIKYIWNNREAIKKYHPKVNGSEVIIEDEKDAFAVSRNLLDDRIIMRLEKHPDDPAKRWPKRLVLPKDQRLSEDSFYTWNLQNRPSHAKMLFILCLVFTVCLYPIWPFAFKFAVFKVSLYLFIGLLGFLVGRLALYLIVRLLGWSFWVFPNLDDESLGFWGSFKPFYSLERQKDGKIEIITRLLGIVLLGLLIFYVVQEPQIMQDFQDAGGQTVEDILDWGKTKLEGKVEPIHKRAIPDLSEILRQEEEDLKNSTEYTQNITDEAQAMQDPDL